MDDNNSSSTSQQSKEHNQQNNRTTDAQTMMHILKANIGTGVLAMPNAFKNVGLWLGFILVPIIGCICIHCMNILIASHNHLCDKFNYESLDYDQVAALGLACGPKFARRLAKRANFVVTIFLIFTQVGFCCVYIMFVVENLQLAILNLFNIEYSTTTYLLIVFPIIGLTSCTSNLKHLARISTFANVLQLAGLGLIFFDLLQFHTYSSQQTTHSLDASVDQSQQQQQTSIISSNESSSLVGGGSQKEFKVDVNLWPNKDILAGLPLFFATAVYAFEGIGVVLPLIKEMQFPSRISGTNGVLNTSMSMVAVLYMAMGFFGYSKYGQFVQGSITLNLPETTLNEVVRFIFAVAIGLSYSLQFYVPWTIMWPHIDESLFYSYRPRVPRDKLEILNKLSAENEWAIDESEWQYQSSQVKHQQQQHQRSSSNVVPASEQTTLTAANSNNNGGGNDQLVVASSGAGGQLEQEKQYLLLDHNSTASTFATSYTMSTCLQASQLQQSSKTRRLNLSSSFAPSGLFQQQHQYGSWQQAEGSPSRCQQQQQQRAGMMRQRRNRLDDLLEDEDEDSMPEVQWRPPPRSMRGKRKLVRYTVILISVSFTFVAAALIPRLDLFISLIGALASSSLAIIFPAIIQMCTFWDFTKDNEEHEDEQDDDDDDDNLYQANKGNKLVSSSSTSGPTLHDYTGDGGPRTGSWVSISQLGALYMGIEGEI